MPVLVKQLKPKRLNDKAMRAALMDEMERTGREVLGDFEATAATWTHKPKFELLMDLSGPGPYVLAGTDDEIYNYVDKGTRPHPIPRAGPGLLAFSEGYTAKTVPGVLGSRAGGPFGGKIVRVTQVMHPGTEPRNFDAMIQRKWDKLFKRRMEAAMRRAAEVSDNPA